jgi:hypothetical protein
LFEIEAVLDRDFNLTEFLFPPAVLAHVLFIFFPTSILLLLSRLIALVLGRLKVLRIVFQKIVHCGLVVFSSIVGQLRPNLKHSTIFCSGEALLMKWRIYSHVAVFIR